jgi:hypothetical protein
MKNLYKNKGIKMLLVGSMLTLSLTMPLQAQAEGKDDTISVPLRTISESIGAKVTWDAGKQQVTVQRGGQSWMMTIGENTAMINGKQVMMSGVASMVDDKTFVPLNALEDALKVQLDWNATEGLTIDSNDVAALGSYYMKLLFEGKYSEARAMMSEHLQSLIPEAMMPRMFNFSATPYGTFKELTAISHEKTKIRNNAYLTYLTSQSVPFQFAVRFDDNNNVDDLYSSIADPSTYIKPSYDHPEKYIEQEVVVGEGVTAVPGTLTLPVGDGPFPSVILVHGSGPSDRDEAIGGYKPFRDLAVGLAAKGIAVLRYEKQTYENSIQSALNPKFTVKEESIDDALKAVKLLQADHRMDKNRIFIIGHSQGGMLIPKIIEQDSNQTIAGAVVMAGPNKPLEDVLLDQKTASLERLKEAGQPEEVIAAAKQQVAAWEQVVQLLHDPKYSTDHMPQGVAIPNAYWWFDFQGYHAGEVAKTQTVPLLVLQGDNDKQVSVNHLDRWKQDLSTRKDVTYALYPRLNHFFVPVDQPSTGEEYGIPGNIPSLVIDDISNWLLKQK